MLPWEWILSAGSGHLPAFFTGWISTGFGGKGEQKMDFRQGRKAAAALLCAAALTTAASAAYTDTEGHWAESAIDRWSGEYGILRGYDDGRLTVEAGKETVTFEKSQVALVRLRVEF